MIKQLFGIGTDENAGAKSYAEDRPHFRVDSRRIVCPTCGHDGFDQRSMLVNTAAMTFMNLEWLNASACVLVCRRCTRMQLFAVAPTNE